MKDNKTWIVAMDFTDMDDHLLKYTLFLSSCLKPNDIHVLHVAKQQDKSSYLPAEFEDYRKQISEEYKQRMVDKVSEMFKDSPVMCQCHVRSGNALDEVIKLVKETSAGLVISGRKKVSGGSGVVSERLSMNLPCDFLLVPENANAQLKTLMVPTDFSEHADLAMEKATAIQRESGEVDVLGMHLYAVPWGYSKSGKTFEEFAEIMRINAEKEMTRWNKKYVEAKSVLKLLRKSAQAEILETAGNNSVDMIIMGSKGQSRVSYALLGSNTMKVMKVNDSIPLMIVKKEGENLDFLDALQRI